MFCLVESQKVNKRNTNMCHFYECALHVHKYICFIYAPSSYFSGLRGSAKRTCKREKMGLQAASALVTDMKPSGCSVKSAVIDCADLGVCMQQALMCPSPLGKNAEKTAVKTSYSFSPKIKKPSTLP